VASWHREPAPLGDTWTVYRQAGAGFPPLWHQGSERRPTPQPSARWHRKGDGHAQYFSFDSDGAWAELIRNAHLRTSEEIEEVRNRLWLCWVEETDIADLSSFDEIADCGLDPALFVGPHEPCHQLADELRQAGFRGLITPSAAIADVTNLTVFGPRREVKRSSRLAAGGNRNPQVYILVNEIASPGPPPTHVVDLTRYGEDPHPGLEAWRATRPC
jgi:hypothetical protein